MTQVRLPTIKLRYHATRSLAGSPAQSCNQIYHTFVTLIAASRRLEGHWLTNNHVNIQSRTSLSSRPGFSTGSRPLRALKLWGEGIATTTATRSCAVSDSMALDSPLAPASFSSSFPNTTLEVLGVRRSRPKPEYIRWIRRKIPSLASIVADKGCQTIGAKQTMRAHLHYETYAQ